MRSPPSDGSQGKIWALAEGSISALLLAATLAFGMVAGTGPKLVLGDLHIPTPRCFQSYADGLRRKVRQSCRSARRRQGCTLPGPPGRRRLFGGHRYELVYPPQRSGVEHHPGRRPPEFDPRGRRQLPQARHTRTHGSAPGSPQEITERVGASTDPADAARLSEEFGSLTIDMATLGY
jgi:hypothetical protein